MFPRRAAERLRRTVKFVIALAMVLLTAGSPLRADSSVPRQPLCREDGVCLPAPRPASEVAAESPPEASQAIAPAPPCEAPLLIKRVAYVTPQAFQRLLKSRGYARVEGLLTPQWWRVCLPEAGPSAQGAELAALLALPEVEFAEPDGIATAAWTPNDPFYPDLGQWGLPKISAPGAWDATLGSSDVMIAVIDSGVDYYHPDSPEFLELGCNMIYQSMHPGDCGDVLDDYGHGTHVTGIAAARTNNGVGVAGLCPGCSTLAIKVLNSSGSGHWSDVADGITYALGASAGLSQRLVINLSIGGTLLPWEQVVVRDAVGHAAAGGAILAAASGNTGAGAPTFLAALPNVLGVSSTGFSDTPSYFSQYGDIAAPGEYVFSTWNDGTSLYSPQPVCVGVGEYECYKHESGTSMSTPLIAAAAGLVWSVHPEYSSFQVRLALLNNVDVPDGWDPLYGVGRLNVERAVTAQEIVLQHVYLPLTVR